MLKLADALIPALITAALGCRSVFHYELYFLHHSPWLRIVVSVNESKCQFASTAWALFAYIEPAWTSLLVLTVTPSAIIAKRTSVTLLPSA